MAHGARRYPAPRMRQLRRLLFVVPVLLLVAAGNLPQSRGDALIVTRKVTKLRSAKRLFAAPIAELVEGDRLVVEAKDGAWYQAKYRELAGWLHETDVSTKKDVRLSGEGVRENYSASETSAARKGFNPQVEREFRRGNPDLEAAFQRLDRIQGRVVAEGEVASFLGEGGLAPQALRETEVKR